MAMHVADSFRSNMRLAARNFAATELLTDISVSSTQLRVKDSTKYPSLDAGEYFLAVLSHANDATKKEIIKVTGVSGDTWTIQRAYEGTTAFAFPSKSAVECRLTAGTIGLVQGMTTKRPSGTAHVAYPYHEYYVDGGSVVTFDLDNFEDGQRAIVRCWQCQTAQRVTLRTGSSDFFYLADERSYAEVMRMGAVFHVTEHGLDAYSEWSVATKGATIPVGSSVRVIGVDGVFDISFAQGASAKSPISVKFEGLGLELGRTAKIKLLGGEQFDVPSRDSELIIDSDCVLTFQRVNSGRWGILDGVGLVGSYHALSRKIEELSNEVKLLKSPPKRTLASLITPLAGWALDEESTNIAECGNKLVVNTIFRIGGGVQTHKVFSCKAGVSHKGYSNVALYNGVYILGYLEYDHSTQSTNIRQGGQGTGTTSWIMATFILEIL